MKNKHACIIICYLNIEHIKRCFDSIYIPNVDYYIIESVFQYVFNNNHKNYTFDYIDSWCPENKKFETLNVHKLQAWLNCGNFNIANYRTGIPVLS